MSVIAGCTNVFQGCMKMEDVTLLSRGKRHSMEHFNQRFRLGAFFLPPQHSDRDLETPG